MPWPHCEHPAINDDLACPTCGMTKAEWSIKVEVTRVFRLGKGFACKVELRDAVGAYAAGVRCRIELPDGTVTESALNPAGYLKGTSKLPGDAVVSFPERGAGVMGVSPGVRPGDAPGTFRCPVGDDKHEFRLVAAWEGDPAAQVDTLVRAAREGTPFCEECARAAEAA